MTSLAPESTRARDERFMRLALAQARLADWQTHPNPMVGAVIVHGEELLATGYHHAAGLDHAEVDALKKLGGRAVGCELFVTLEPCNHFARTPPCTQALIAAGIRRCVIGCVDPDPRVSGAGIAALEAAGVRCEVGVLCAECSELNEPFFKRVAKGLPYVTLKLAMSLDGRIATRAGESQWITGPQARADGHALRARHDAILVGTTTVTADNPRLNVRDAESSRTPLRIVLDRRLRIPSTAAVFDLALGPTLLVTSEALLAEARVRFPHLEAIGVASTARGLDLRAVLRELAAREITTLLCEGGAGLAGSLVDDDLVDHVVCYVAPRILGSQHALGPVGEPGVERLADALTLDFGEPRRLGPDLRLDARKRRS